jgi:hypothetical protein
MSTIGDQATQIVADNGKHFGCRPRVIPCAALPPTVAAAAKRMPLDAQQGICQAHVESALALSRVTTFGELRKCAHERKCALTVKQ